MDAREVQTSVFSAVNLMTANPGPTVNSNAVVVWGVKNLIPLVLLIIGLGIVALARMDSISDNANALTNVVLGMGAIAGACALCVFVSQLTDLVFET